MIKFTKGSAPKLFAPKSTTLLNLPHSTSKRTTQLLIGIVAFCVSNIFEGVIERFFNAIDFAVGNFVEVGSSWNLSSDQPIDLFD